LKNYTLIYLLVKKNLQQPPKYKAVCGLLE